ncbi:MAG: hypothetical protein NTV78_03845 [Caldiserica bacterium]|nr:hypothetical protein [Caldisericota bacterium]
MIKTVLIPSGLLFIISRGFGKISGGVLGNIVTRMNRKEAFPIGISLLSQSTLTIYFAAHAKGFLLNYGEMIFAITISGVIFFEIIGAPLLKLMITKIKTIES